MATKLTLFVPEKVMRTAGALSRKRKKSISALVVELIEREAERDKDPFENLRRMWKDNDVDADEVRDRAWKRSYGYLHQDQLLVQVSIAHGVLLTLNEKKHFKDIKG